jgi:hypothetical protein
MRSMASAAVSGWGSVMLTAGISTTLRQAAAPGGSAATASTGGAAGGGGHVEVGRGVVDVHAPQFIDRLGRNIKGMVRREP